MEGRNSFIDTIEEDAVEILAHASFQPVPYRRRQEELAKRLGLDFSDILAAFDYIPLALSGEAHKRQRARIARILNARQEKVTSELPGMVARNFGRLRRAGPIDILEECIDPFINEVLSMISGAPPDLDITLISRIFSRNLGVSQRRKMQQQLRSLRENLALTHPDDTEEQLGERMALLILGRDALLGTLARSLHHTLERADGRRLCDIDPHTFPTRTGVPFIDREATEDVTLKGHKYSTGDVVRCQLRSIETGPEIDYLRFFGKGAHLCLGRSISLAVFKEVGTYLASLSVRIVDIDFALRRDDVFLYPETFKAVVEP